MNSSSTGSAIPKRPKWARYRRAIFLPASLILALLAWELVIQIWDPPSFILPAPALVWDSFTQVLLDGSLLRHTLVTLSEVIIGLVLGVCLGMRTLAIRLDKQGAAALEIARWLQNRPVVKRVLHPALEGDPGHALWKRDFKGASGLFGVELQPCSKEQVAALMDHCEHFGIGYSWGGFESLVVPANLRHGRKVRPWDGGPLIRLHIGLEDPADLVADLDVAFARWRAAA